MRKHWMHRRDDTDGENGRPQGWKKKRGHVENKGIVAISLDLHNHPIGTKS